MASILAQAAHAHSKQVSRSRRSALIHLLPKETDQCAGPDSPAVAAGATACASICRRVRDTAAQRARAMLGTTQ